MSLFTRIAFALAVVTATAGSSAAAVIHSDDFADPTGARETDTSFSTIFNATGGTSAISFDIEGFISLDGDNSFKDEFVLNLNGTDIFRGTFNLGGGGTDSVSLGGASFSFVTSSVVSFSGGIASISGVLSLLAGANTLTFSYLSAPNPDFAGFQGLGDEGWGVNNVDVANAVTTVPVPPAALLLLSGFAGLAGLRRFRKAV